MQSKDEPNFYLKHGFDKKYADCGCPYVQENCDVQKPSDNLVIYGHHMKSGLIFADLERFKDKDFQSKHKTGSFDTLCERQTYEIIAVFKTTVYDLLQSHTARTMLANSEFIVMLNQASTDRIELAKLLNISDTQISYVTNVDAGHGLIKVGSSLIPFSNKFPKNTKLYRLMTTKPGEGA